MENESIKKNTVEIVRNKNRHELQSELKNSNSDSKRKEISVQEIIEKMSRGKIDAVCVFFFIYKLQKDVYNGDESHPTPKLDSREIGTYIHIYEKGVLLKKSGRFDSIE